MIPSRCSHRPPPPPGSAGTATGEAVLQRTLSATLFFAAVALLVTGVLSWVAYRGVRTALEVEFGRRLETLAATAASQVSPADIRDIQLLGEDGSGYIALQLILEELRSSTGLANASALDTARVTLYDCRRAERQREVSVLDTLARSALDRAMSGQAAVSRSYRVRGELLRAGFAPVTSEGRVVALVTVESRVDYLPVLAEFRRTLVLTTLLIALVIVALAAAIVRTVASSTRLERRLSRAENLAAMGRLTATLAHEIKNPLAIIRGSAQRLGKLDPEARRWADSVVEETDRLSGTVARYLRFARGEQVPGAAGDAARALGETLDLLEGEFRARRVALERSGAPDQALPVRLDNESLKQIFLNLILNALEAMVEGGRLTVTTGERRGRAEVCVTDTGLGMPAETLRQLGQPFHTTKAQGSGLGLFLTRRLVQSGGGTLTIESEVGRGTTCTVRLPRRKG